MLVMFSFYPEYLDDELEYINYYYDDYFALTALIVIIYKLYAYAYSFLSQTTLYMLLYISFLVNMEVNISVAICNMHYFQLV